jgi:hypothetical protein
MNSLQLGEGGGLAIENDFRSATCGTSHFDGSPGWDEVTNIEDLQDCFFRSESFRKSRGSCGAVTAILQFVIREKTSAITIPKNLQGPLDFVDGLNIDANEGTFHHGRMLTGPLGAR